MKMMLLAVVLSALAMPQTPPPAANTEVFLVDLAAMKAATAAGKTPPAVVNISNNPDYDNQPSFTPDGAAVLFSSKRDGKQTDIYRYDIAKKALTELTHTTDSEYSPLVTPDKTTFSVIRQEPRQEADGSGAVQHLWRFNMDGSNPRVLLATPHPIGYHAWIDATHLAVYVLGANGAPPTLQFVDTSTGKAETVTTGIGRAILIRPGVGALTYADMRRAPLSIWQVDPKTHATSTIVPLTEGANGAGTQDFAWDPSVKDGQAVFAWGTRLMAWWPESTGARAHQPLGDLGASGVTRITRLTVSPDGKWLAFVAEPAGK